MYFVYSFLFVVLRGNTVQPFEKYWIGVGDIHDDAANIARIPGVKEAEGIFISGDMTTALGVPAAKKVVKQLQAVNPHVRAQIGNMDGEEVQIWLEEEGLNIHRKVMEIAPQIWVMGLGWASTTPFATPSEVPDGQLALWLEESYAQLPANYKQLLLISHTPPFGTTVDDIGNDRHVGSQAIRDFIEKVRPTACLTGHIHEAKAVETLAGTTIVNPGMLAEGGYAVIGIREGALTLTLQTVS